MHGSAQEQPVGDPVRIEVPFGNFYLRDSNRSVILVASGTGFAPIKSIVESAIQRGWQRPMRQQPPCSWRWNRVR